MSVSPGIVLQKGTLWQALTTAAEDALASGALLPLPTEYEFIKDGGVRFFVRILTGLEQKDEERRRQAEAGKSGVSVNPFLPHEQALFVADISRTHLAVLNKFNVVEHHLLIITREYEDQETLLTVRDFEALCACLMEYRSLGFYNGGEAAGASQRHKHLQIVPLPLAPEGPALPVEPLLTAAEFRDGIGTVGGFPFIHALARIKADVFQSSAHAAEKTFALYCAMLRHVGLRAPGGDRPEVQSGPYCLLLTRDWMLLLPRSREFFDGISVNSLGFAGALLVRNREQVGVLREYGPMNVLKAVAVPRRGL